MIRFPSVRRSIGGWPGPGDGLEARQPAPHGVLFLCSGNAARSQMAEGFARGMLPPGVRVWSAGTRPADSIHPMAVRAMAEVGIDISWQRPKRLRDVPMGDIDTVITLCGDDLGLIPGAVRIESWPLPDPTQATGSESEVLAVFRRVRDEIRRQIEALFSQAARFGVSATDRPAPKPSPPGGGGP